MISPLLGRLVNRVSEALTSVKTKLCAFIVGGEQDVHYIACPFGVQTQVISLAPHC